MSSSHRPPSTWAYNLSALLEQRPELAGVGVTDATALGVMSA